MPATSGRGAARAVRTIEIGGRKFSSWDASTARQDDFVGSLLPRAFGQGSDENEDAFARRILEEMRESGQTNVLLGGLMLPEGMTPAEWRPEVAAHTAEFLDGITDPEDKATRGALVLDLVIHFFVSGLISLERSTRSSAAESGVVATAGDQPSNVRVFATANGAASSAP